MTELRIRIADTVKRLSRTGYTIKVQNRTGKHNQNTLISTYEVYQLVKSLTEESKKLLSYSLIQPKYCKVTKIYDVESYTEENIDPIEEAFEGKPGITAYLTFNANIIFSSKSDLNIILNDFASAVLDTIMKGNAPGKGQGISVSVAIDESRPSTVNVGVMFEGLS